jgi:hypothetical protein
MFHKKALNCIFLHYDLREIEMHWSEGDKRANEKPVRDDSVAHKD